MMSTSLFTSVTGQKSALTPDENTSRDTWSFDKGTAYDESRPFLAIQRSTSSSGRGLKNKRSPTARKMEISSSGDEDESKDDEEISRIYAKAFEPEEVFETQSWEGPITKQSDTQKRQVNYATWMMSNLCHSDGELSVRPTSPLDERARHGFYGSGDPPEPARLAPRLMRQRAIGRGRWMILQEGGQVKMCVTCSGVEWI